MAVHPQEEGGGGTPRLDPPPRALQTKVTRMGENNNIYNAENLLGPFSMHSFFGPRPPLRPV